ncbi:gliding motility-associated C-terminal domain-containing protein [Carboxylicivirga caseinilyticus]|uniref:T9SS type B sorting domain-containing protein n=1 Tax=Carboxylicivirga caseinilyticus TaxID=3417572 RepID=UPI003D33AA1A|nr:gliding motility-associated C-terminal domain-containing protein [Marinilabiliaceae bacterium A049]
MIRHLQIAILSFVFALTYINVRSHNNVISFSPFTLSVNEIQSSVIAYNDYAVVNESETVRINVLNNDIGVNEGVGSLVVESDPAHGTVIVNNDNTIQYTPEKGYNGMDQFTYKVCNNSGSCDEAIVDIRVDDVHYIPEAVNDSMVYFHETNTVYSILDNDIIKGDLPYVVTILQNFTKGDAYLDDDSLIPAFPRNFGGIDSLQYSLCDADNDCSEAWVFIDVQNDGTTDFFIPNGFSPNGDGYNDTFYIPDFRQYTNISVTIINEWGQTVFSESNYQNNWNGNANSGLMKGKSVPSGTYYYVFSIEGISQSLTGSIYLSR